MTDTNLAKALRAHMADEPPMRLTSGAVIAAGRRSRHRRWLLATAGALAAVVAVTAGATALLPDGSAPAPLAAAPDPGTCAALRGPSPSPVGAEAAPARADAEPAADAAAVRVSCYLLQAVPALLPGATYAANPARRGTAALVAAPGGMGGGDLEVTATSLVTDPAGTGLLIVAVSRDAGFTVAEKQARCAGPTAKAQCRTGPNGEHIEIYDFGVEPNGAHGITVYVYSGHTFVLAGTRNTDETQDAAPSRPEPPLTVDQLITLATAPELRLYP